MDPTGLVVYHGYIVTEWGDPARVDMTHSVTQSFLSTIIGVSVVKGLIHSTTDTIWHYIPPIEVFDPANNHRSAENLGKQQMLYPISSAHNRLLIWDIMLRLTSDWVCYMNFFPNTDKKFLPDAPANAFVYLGNRANIIYVDPDHDLVIVAVG